MARGDVAAVRVVAAIVGDFIAPSLLSCLDQGRGTWIYGLVYIISVWARYYTHIHTSTTIPQA